MVDFKGAHYPKSVILFAVFFYLRVERQPPCPRATTILAGFQAAEVGVSFNVSG
jgi:hypothetical protein